MESSELGGPILGLHLDGAVARCLTGGGGGRGWGGWVGILPVPNAARGIVDHIRG